MQNLNAEELQAFNKKLRLALFIQLLVAATVTVVSLIAVKRVAPLVEEQRVLTRRVEEQRQALATANAQVTAAQRHTAAARLVVQAANSGNNAYTRHDIRAAIKYYDMGLQADPDNGFLWNLKGGSYFEEGDYPNAVESFRKATEVDPTYAYGFFDLARGYCALNEFDLADQSFGHALQLWSDLRMTAASDGQFRRICRPLVIKYDLPRVPPKDQPKWLDANKNRFQDPQPLPPQ